jgi:hypothetical protein
LETSLANLQQDYAREREHSEIFNKNLWEELIKELKRREEGGLLDGEP